MKYDVATQNRFSRVFDLSFENFPFFPKLFRIWSFGIRLKFLFAAQRWNAEINVKFQISEIKISISLKLHNFFAYNSSVILLQIAKFYDHQQ